MPSVLPSVQTTSNCGALRPVVRIWAPEYCSKDCQASARARMTRANGALLV
ncbi:hypothetical protein KBTX_02143 [wastewater metagenome]|uniref:Uncharacterized protein n=2 Tax=unclassified sequences TaxID=12908 RepID=A0A5B8RGL0_9ZZZZ|nr:hypothetical protein KBTEX_02143 [uncultured organism]